MKSLALQNVKAFKDKVDIELAPITVFVGQNSCGKSSIIRFPAVLAQTTNSDSDSIALYKKHDLLIDYGTFRDVVHNHKEEESFIIEMTFDFDVLDPGLSMPAWMKDDLSSEKVTTSIQIEFKKIQGNIVISNYLVFRNGTELCKLSLCENGKYTFWQNQVNDVYCFTNVECKIELPEVRFKGLAPYIGLNNNEIIIMAEILQNVLGITDIDKFDMAEQLLSSICTPTNMIWEIPESMYEEIKDFRSKDGIIVVKRQIEDAICVLNSILRYSSAFNQLREALEEDLSDLTYIGPFRAEPERVIRRDESWKSDYVGRHGEMTTPLLINDSIDNHDDLHSVSEWCKKILKCEIDINPIGHDLYELVVKKDNGITYNIMDVGYGVSQLLPIITQMVFLHNKSHNSSHITIVEQPELHLHPNAQAELAELFAAVIKDNPQSKILIETHSEHLIRGLQLLIADQESPYHLSREQVKVYNVYDESDKECEDEASFDDFDGSRVKEMKLDEYGQFLTKWHSGFFDKAYNQMLELSKIIRTQKRTVGK